MSEPTLALHEVFREGIVDTRNWTDRFLAERALSKIQAVAEGPLRHPWWTEQVALHMVREAVWSYQCEVRDRQAVRDELYAMVAPPVAVTDPDHTSGGIQ